MDDDLMSNAEADLVKWQPELSGEARAHVERIVPVIDEALRRAQVRLDQIDAVAVAHTPGL